MNAPNEVTDTIALLMKHGFFQQVRRQEFFEGVFGGLLGHRVSVAISDSGPDGGDARFVVDATRTGDGRTARARGATVEEAIKNVSWMNLLT